MSRSLNKVTLIGNVGGDPDVRTTPSGTRLAKLSLATSRSFRDRSDQDQERTQWHRLTIFGRLVDVVEQWVRKGDRLYVEGRIEYSQTQDDHGGTRYWTDIVVQEMIMLGSSEGRGGGSDRGQGGARGSYDRGDSQWGGRSRDPAPVGGGSGSDPSAGSSITEPDDDLPF